MSTATADPTSTTVDAAAEITAASSRLEARMTSQYTPVWDVFDFLLDSAAALAGDPLAVAEVHEILKELAPSARRTLLRTTEVAAIIESVRRLAAVPVETADMS